MSQGAWWRRLAAGYEPIVFPQESYARLPHGCRPDPAPSPIVDAAVGQRPEVGDRSGEAGATK